MNIVYVHTDGTTSTAVGTEAVTTSSSVVSGSTVRVSVEKNLVKSGGWLARVNLACAAFTTAAAAKNWCIEEYNQQTGDSRKRLPWVKVSDHEFTAHANISPRGKISFEK